jgi:UDP-glucose-4-epimerase GalE
MSRRLVCHDWGAEGPAAGRAVLVTGGAGYIGSHACKALAEAGYVPVAYDNLVHGHAEAVQWGPLVIGDLADRRLLADTMARFGISAVMHFAAFACVGESMAKPEIYFRNNVVNSLGLLESMVELGIHRLVFSSTCATYGLPETIPMDEAAPQRPLNPYGESKLMVERALDWYDRAHGLRFAALRYFNAAGADPKGRIGEAHDPETHLIPLIFDAILGRRAQIEIFGTDYSTPDGSAVRDYVHVDDLVRAHVLALERLRAGGGSLAVNLGSGEGYSVRQVIAAVERITGRRTPQRESPRRPGDPPVLTADPRLARELLGWVPQHSDLDTIIRTAWAWHARDAHAMSASIAV